MDKTLDDLTRVDHQGHTVLIVDDNSDSRRLLIKLLLFPEFDVREADNGQTGIEMWKTWQPHLIFMDMRMPLLNGYEATKKIRALETENWILDTSNSEPDTSPQPPTPSIQHPASSIQHPASSIQHPVSNHHHCHNCRFF